MENEVQIKPEMLLAKYPNYIGHTYHRNNWDWLWSKGVGFGNNQQTLESHLCHYPAL